MEPVDRSAANPRGEAGDRATRRAFAEKDTFPVERHTSDAATAQRSGSGSGSGSHGKRTLGARSRSGPLETKTRAGEHLIPKCPPWLPRETYTKLAALRASL